MSSRGHHRQLAEQVDNLAMILITPLLSPPHHQRLSVAWFFFSLPLSRVFANVSLHCPLVDKVASLTPPVPRYISIKQLFLIFRQGVHHHWPSQASPTLHCAAAACNVTHLEGEARKPPAGMSGRLGRPALTGEPAVTENILRRTMYTVLCSWLIMEG